MKTNFLIAGASRSGTATLSRCIMQHPQASLPTEMRTGFFLNDELFERGNPNPSNYHQHFESSTDAKCIGECEPMTLYWQEGIPRVYRYNPDMKMIVVLRNPIERAYSDWQQAVNRGAEHMDFVSAINLEPHRIRELGQKGQCKNFSYLDKGFYSRQLKHLYQYFDPHQVLCLRAENIADNPEVAVYQVFEFLDLPYIEVDTAAQQVGNYTQSMPAEVYNELIEIYRRDVYRVEELLGWNCSDWLQPKTIAKPVKAMKPVFG